MRYLVTALAAAAVLAVPAASAVWKYDAALVKAIDSPIRSEANKARDKYRHPLQTLSFFGAKSNQTIVEIWPGNGWYTEILAPFTKSGNGTLYAAGPSIDRMKARAN